MRQEALFQESNPWQSPKNEDFGDDTKRRVFGEDSSLFNGFVRGLKIHSTCEQPHSLTGPGGLSYSDIDGHLLVFKLFDTPSGRPHMRPAGTLKPPFDAL